MRLSTELLEQHMGQEEHLGADPGLELHHSASGGAGRTLQRCRVGAADPERLRISVVIPALNEARNLPHVFARLPADVYEVILVDGRSVDDTVGVARALRPDVRVVSQTGRGKGNALACGFAAATGDIIATVDADGSVDPSDIPGSWRRFLTALTLSKEHGSPQVGAAMTLHASALSVISF